MATATGVYEVTAGAGSINVQATGGYLVTGPVTTVATSGTYTVTSASTTTVQAGDVVTISVPTGATAVTVSGVSPAPAVTGTGSVRQMVAPIVTVDTTLTVYATVNGQQQIAAVLLVRKAVRRVHFAGGWRPSYKLVVLEQEQVEPSPTAVPVGDLDGGWSQVYVEDFATPVAEGGFVTRTTGDLGMFEAANPYVNSWKAKERLSIPPGEPATRYDAQTTMSVTNSVLRTRLQKLPDGTLRAGACKPIFGNGVDFAGPTKIRWRSWADGAAGFSYVFDFIGSNEDWTAGGGELGFPENGVAYSNAHVFYRPKATSSGAYAIQSSDMGVDQRQPHIYEVTWTPGVSLVGTVDGATVLTDTNPATVWATPKRWLMQSGGASSTAVGTEGNVYIDWITVWTRPA